jgi:hypothetical protein
MLAALEATVTVVLTVAATVGVKVNCPLVQDEPAAITAFAVQVPNACVKCALDEANGVAPRVILPPFAVKVTVPHGPEVFTPWVAEHVSEAGVTVK